MRARRALAGKKRKIMEVKSRVSKGGRRRRGRRIHGLQGIGKRNIFHGGQR